MTYLIFYLFFKNFIFKKIHFNSLSFKKIQNNPSISLKLTLLTIIKYQQFLKALLPTNKEEVMLQIFNLFASHHYPIINFKNLFETCYN